MRYLHGTYRHTWVSTHKEHSQTQETQIRKHTNANRHTHAPPLLSHTPTHSQVMSVHTQRYTFCLLVCRSIHHLLWQLLSLHCLSLLPFPSPSIHTAYHVLTVSLPINAHRAALQWSWRVPRQQAQYRVYRHACTCQAGRTRLGGGGEGGRGGGGGGEREKESEWRICWVRQTGRLCATMHIYRDIQSLLKRASKWNRNRRAHVHNEGLFM